VSHRRNLSRRHTRAWHLRPAIVAAFALLALALPPIGSSIVNIEGVTNDQLPDYDSRGEVTATEDDAPAAGAAAVGVHVTWNSLGTPSSMIRYGGYLKTGIQARSADAAARTWVASQRGLFRAGSADNLSLVTAKRLAGSSNLYVAVYRQTFGRLLSADGLLSVGLAGSSQTGWKITYASSTLAPATKGVTGAWTLSPLAAWARAAGYAGHRISVLSLRSAGKNAAGATRVAAVGFDGQQTVGKVAFGTAKRGAIRAYSAVVTRTVRGELTSYQVIVAAKTGKLLYRQSQVDNIADNPTWLAPRHSMPYNNLNAFPWNYPTTDNRVVHCWNATAGCAVVVGDNPATTVYPFGVASKFPWDVQLNSAGTDLGTKATVGNNVDDARLWSGNRGPGATAYGNPALVRATSATRDYQPAFTDAWYTSGCNPNNVNAAINPLGNDIEASTVSLFVGHNVMHDFAYYLGFDEGHWNAQQYNNGVTVNDPSPTPGGPTIAAPLANDGLIGNAQAGAATGSRDNANMNTGADGNHPTTNQFVWQPLAASFYAPCVDGAYDFAVFGHEFGHLIENRMIGKGVGARQGTHAGSMGEAFGDFDALAAFNELHLPVPAGADRYTEGAYATGNGYNGIRDFLAGRPMGGEFPEPGKNPDTDPLNYGDFGFDNVGVEVHADGELWVAVQMDLRDLFLSRNPSPGEATDIACARGQIAPTACPGDRQWIQDYYDAMVMMPRNTTMIQARDAMLAADVARFGGANQDLLWQGFAMRGFGQFQNTVSNGDSNPVPDFSSPLADNTTVNFFADTTDGTLPVNAKIYVGDYEARATQIADTDAATVNAGTPATGNLDNTAQFAPTSPESLVGKTDKRWSAYNFTAVAPGYGFVRFSMKFLKPGQTRNVTIHFAKNYASAAQGATIVGDALGTNTNLGNLIDDTEATNNGQTGAPVGGRWVVVKLGTTKAVPIASLGVSALLVPGNNRFTALRSFQAYACTEGKPANPTCDGSVAAGWTQIVDSPANAFPSVNPRPVTPDETLRYFNALGAPPATHVKFVVVANQCTGQPSYAGDQDNDPNNNADCPATARASEVHANELQVFGSAANVVDAPRVG
jgi:extracellular elastinolytic metalloproteinase